MNTLVIVLIAAVLLSCAYVFYGRWLANKWGIDPKAETPAKKFEDGKDYVPTDGWTVFSHQFSSIAGAGPVTGAIQAAVFGWVPVFLWIIVGGIFFGAVTDFGALYASVKNEGKSMGLLTNRYLNGIPEDSRIMTDGRFLKKDALTEEKLMKIRALNEVAAGRGQTLAEMALSWILRDGIVTSVLVGASKPQQLLDNIKAIENTEFSEKELKKIDELSL